MKLILPKQFLLEIIFRCLKNLNLSFNRITDLSGLKAFHNHSHQLQRLDIFGNKVRSVNHVVQCLSQCTTLKTIYFKKEEDENPVCALPAYRPNVLAQMPWLANLDGYDKHGNVVQDDFNSSDIPGKYWQFHCKIICKNCHYFCSFFFVCWFLWHYVNRLASNLEKSGNF